MSKRHRIHLSGPMTGLTNRNEPAFREAERTLLAMGHQVFQPQDIPAETEYRVALMQNLVFICEAATAQVLLPGSEASPGSRAERAAAAALGLPQYAEYHGDFYLLDRNGRRAEGRLKVAAGLQVVGGTDA